MEMTRERLEGYRSCREEIRELQYKLAHLGDGDNMIGNDVILDYRTGYPRTRSVVGWDHKREERLRTVYENRIAKLETECAETELWVDEIPDSLTRRIFRMYYIEGKSQKQIGRAVHLDRSMISKKICRYLKDAHNSHDSHL